MPLLFPCIISSGSRIGTGGPRVVGYIGSFHEVLYNCHVTHLEMPGPEITLGTLASCQQVTKFGML